MSFRAGDNPFRSIGGARFLGFGAGAAWQWLGRRLQLRIDQSINWLNRKSIRFDRMVGGFGVGGCVCNVGLVGWKNKGRGVAHGPSGRELTLAESCGAEPRLGPSLSSAPNVSNVPQLTHLSLVDTPWPSSPQNAHDDSPESLGARLCTPRLLSIAALVRPRIRAGRCMGRCMVETSINELWRSTRCGLPTT